MAPCTRSGSSHVSLWPLSQRSLLQHSRCASLFLSAGPRCQPLERNGKTPTCFLFRAGSARASRLVRTDSRLFYTCPVHLSIPLHEHGIDRIDDATQGFTRKLLPADQVRAFAVDRAPRGVSLSWQQMRD